MSRLSLQAAQVTLLCLFLLPLLPAESAGQLAEGEPLDVRIFVLGGALLPTQNLASSSDLLLEDQIVQAVSEFESASVFGGGIEVLLPDPNLRIRARYNQSVDGTADGRLLICSKESGFDPTGICTPQRVDATVRAFGAELIFALGQPGQRLRALLQLGAGVRSYDFDEPDCSAAPLGDERFVCNLVADMWEDPPSADPYLSFGAGAQVNLTRRFDLQLLVQDWFGEFSAGGDRAEGNQVNDITISVGLSTTLFSLGR